MCYSEAPRRFDLRLRSSLFAAAVAVGVPMLARAQHSHGAGGMDLPQRREKHDPSPAAAPRGILPPGSPRQVEVLVVAYGFSPKEIKAAQGEQIVLSVRRSDPSHCNAGLAIPTRQVLVQLPVGETIPVTLKLDRAETIDLVCANEDARASIIVAPK